MAFSSCSGRRSDAVTVNEAGPIEEPCITLALILANEETEPENVKPASSGSGVGAVCLITSHASWST